MGSFDILHKIIDTHIHLSERKDDILIPYARINGLEYTLEELLRLMEQQGVAKGLLLSPPLQSGVPLPNEEVIDICSKSDLKLLPILTAEPETGAIRAAIKLAQENRENIRGFKIRLGYVNAYATDPIFDKLYDFAEVEHLPVLFHTGDTATNNGSLSRSHPLTLDALANKREALTIVLCHFGNPWFQDAAELIYKHQNVFVDISGLITGGGRYPEKYMGWVTERINEAIYYAGGADKVIFGTDYPVSRYLDVLQLVERLDISEEDRENILWRNASAVFRL